MRKWGQLPFSRECKEQITYRRIGRSEKKQVFAKNDYYIYLHNLFNRLWSYDKKEKNVKRDEWLNSFAKEKGDMFNACYKMISADTVYMVSNYGLYEHVLGTNDARLILDKRTCNLGEECAYPVWLEILDSENFFILYDDGNIYKYTYTYGID